MNDNVVKSEDVDILRKSFNQEPVEYVSEIYNTQTYSTIWDIRVLTEVTYRVKFPESVTLQEAEERLLDGDFDDIIDVLDEDIIKVVEKEYSY